jgi:hypothetical protein
MLDGSHPLSAVGGVRRALFLLLGPSRQQSLAKPVLRMTCLGLLPDCFSLPATLLQVRRDFLFIAEILSDHRIDIAQGEPGRGPGQA